MKKILYVVVIQIFLIANSCSPVKKIAQLQSEALDLYETGNYSLSLERAEAGIHLLRNKTNDDGILFRIAGLSAHALGYVRQSIDYLEIAIKAGGANANCYSVLADNYRKIDNLSREISALESYLQNHPEGSEITEIRNRLFIIQVNIEHFDQADILWRYVYTRDLSDEELLTAGLRLNRYFERTETCDELARKVLSRNHQNVHALDWLARRHYWMAENRYQAEMKAYEFNPTRAQYAKLLDAFKVLNQDFKLALDYFLKLYGLKPEKEYAHFIGNIYLRFEDKAKAASWHAKAK